MTTVHKSCEMQCHFGLLASVHLFDQLSEALIDVNEI